MFLLVVVFTLGRQRLEQPRFGWGLAPRCSVRCARIEMCRRMRGRIDLPEQIDRDARAQIRGCDPGVPAHILNNRHVSGVL